MFITEATGTSNDAMIVVAGILCLFTPLITFVSVGGEYMGKDQNAKKTGFGIRGQMLIKLLPTVIIAMVALTLVSAINSKTTINNETQNTMNSELQSNSNQINADLDLVRNQAVNLAREVSIYYKNTSMDVFKKSFSEAINSSDIINGAGIWFEPNGTVLVQGWR